jgi:hypothetical protein
MNKDVAKICWILFNKELTNNITPKRNYKNINFWYLSYSIGLFFGYFTYKIPTKKDSLVLYCDKCIKENKDKRIKRMINEVKELFQNRPVTFCYNNMSDECLSIWNYITTKYLE